MPTDPNQWSPVLQYGAFGLCVFLGTGFFAMTWLLLKGHREERQTLVATLDRQAANLLGLYQSSQKALDNNTEALERMSAALGDRPCLLRDSRVGGREGST
jgi:hypothetical protein